MWRSSRGLTGGVVAEVEAQPVGSHQAAGLLDVRAEHLAQRGVQQVGAGVVAHGAGAPLGVDLGAHHHAALEAAGLTRTWCTCRPGRGLVVSRTSAAEPSAGDDAVVAHLAARSA